MSDSVATPQAGMGLVVVGISGVAVLVAGAAADALRLGTNTAQALSAVAASGPSAGALFLQHRKMGRREELNALARDEVGRSPLLIVGVLGPALLLVDSLVGFLLGAIVGLVVEISRGSQNELGPAYASVSLLVGFPLMLWFTYRLSQYASHFVRVRTTLWLACAVGVYALLRGLAIFSSGGSLRELGIEISGRNLLVSLAVVVPLMIIAAWAGKRRASAKHGEFLVTRLFRKLPRDDQQATLELLHQNVIHERL